MAPNSTGMIREIEATALLYVTIKSLCMYNVPYKHFINAMLQNILEAIPN